jgi:hypothetical protein
MFIAVALAIMLISSIRALYTLIALVWLLALAFQRMPKRKL